MMLFVGSLVLWTALGAGAAVAVWKRVTTHHKVYALIVIHGLYSAGVFFLYERLLGP
ncbi:hypothetical protein [Desulfosoma sp.]